MKKLIALLLLLGAAHLSMAQEKLSDDDILKLYQGLRVADVSDGMEMVGLRDAGLLDQSIGGELIVWMKEPKPEQ